MAYTPTTWVGGVTKVGPTNLNHLEGGVQAAAAVADSALPTPGGVDGQFLQRVSGLWVPHTLVAADMPSGIPYSKLSLAGSIVSGDITDGTLVNADINGSAAIALAKLADPTTGKVVGSSGGAAAAVFPPGFELDRTARTTALTVNTVAEGSATVFVTSASVTFDGTSSYDVDFYCPGLAWGGGGLVGGVNLWRTFNAGAAADQGRLIDMTTVGNVAADYPGGTHTMRFTTPAAGAYVFSARAWAGAANLVIVAGVGGAGVAAPAFIRVRKAT